MAMHKKRIKGSTICIAAMYVLWIAYICAQIWEYANYQMWLPSEVTYATAACFIVETVSLARIKLAKEGNDVPARKSNQFLSKLGLASESELEEVVAEINAKNKEGQNG